jgi:predicted porin
MRKLLLASAAMLGATTGLASAQVAAPHPNEGKLITPWAGGNATNNNNNASGIANEPNVYAPNTVAVPTPGTVVIRINGRVEVHTSVDWTSGDRVVAGGSVFKVNPINFTSYFRMYPGVDGMAANGLRYGASVELRENFGTPVSATGAVVSPSAYSSTETVFVRRAFAYLATDQAGLVRIGQTDGVIGLFDNCTFTNQCWDGGVGTFNGAMLQGDSPQAGVAIPYAWLSQAGSEYSNSKIVYLSPQFFGFDFGVQYAPSMGNSNSNSAPGLCNAAGVSCNSLSSGNDATRWLNQVAVGARYQGDFGAVKFGAFGVYETAGKESGPFVAATALAPAARRATAVTGFRYDNLSFFNAAAYASFAGFTISGDWIGGALNGQLAMRPQGGASESAVITGVTYRLGPWTLGASYAQVDSQGDARLTGLSQRHESEYAFGGSYNVAPGMFLVGEYMYTQRHQGGFDFIAGTAAGAGGAPVATRDAKGQGLMFAVAMNW